MRRTLTFPILTEQTTPRPHWTSRLTAEVYNLQWNCRTGRKDLQRGAVVRAVSHLRYLVPTGIGIGYCGNFVLLTRASR